MADHTGWGPRDSTKMDFVEQQLRKDGYIRPPTDPPAVVQGPGDAFGPSGTPGPPVPQPAVPPSAPQPTPSPLRVPGLTGPQAQQPRAHASSCDIGGRRCAGMDWKSVALHPAVVAIAAGVVAMIILALLNPPFVRGNADDAVHRGGPAPWKLGVAGLTTAAAVFALPFVWRKISRSCVRGGGRVPRPS